MDSVPQVWERTTREPWRDPLPLVPDTGPRHGPGTQARAGDPGTGRGVPSRAETGVGSGGLEAHRPYQAASRRAVSDMHSSPGQLNATSNPRLVAGRAMMVSYHRFTLGKSARSTLCRSCRQAQPRIAKSAIEHSSAT